MATQIIVRRLETGEDLVQADALYRAHSGRYLPIPDPDDTWASIDAGEVYGCFKDGSQLVAVGGIYLVANALDHNSKLIGIHEMAGLVVHPNLRGMRPYGLQDVLVAVRVAALAAGNSTGICLITSVADKNSGSRKSMQRCGLEMIPEATVPQWLKDVRRTWRTEDAPKVIDHIVLPSALPSLKRIFTAISAGVLTQAPENGTPVEYRLSISDPGELELVLDRTASLDGWIQTVPQQRVINMGKNGIFTWPRT